VLAAPSVSVTLTTTLVAAECDGSSLVVVISRESTVVFAGTTLSASAIGRSTRDEASTLDPSMKLRSIDAIVAAPPPDSRSLTVTRYQSQRSLVAWPGVTGVV
jgi:hypothetical protein